ncbi:MAG: M16 family metallopeptidase, partial [Blastocatellia bacterium]
MSSRISFPASITILVVALFVAGRVDAQSGRRRTRYPQSEEPASPPPSIKVPLTTSVVKQAQHGDVSRFILQNGMTVLVNEVHAYPIAASVAYIKSTFTGSNDLMAARVLQQLMLRGGTSTNPGPALSTEIEGGGGTLDADSTAGGSYFIARVPSGQIKQAVSLQADLIQNPAMTPSMLGPALDAVKARESSYCESPALYAGNRASAMSLGLDTAAPPDQISVESLRALYADRYKPQNLVLVITGDVSTFDVVVQIEQLYAQFGVPPPGPAPEPNSQDESKTSPSTAPQPAPTASTSPSRETANATQIDSDAEPSRQTPILGGPSVSYSETRGGIHQTIVTTAYRTPGLSSPDWAAVQVLADLMGRGPGSRLVTRLVTEQAAARAVTSHYSVMPDAGVLTIQMWLAPDLIDKAEAELFKAVDRVILEPPGAADLAEAKGLAEKAFYDRVSTYDDRALFFAIATAGGRPAMILPEYVDLIRAVTPADVQRVARQYLALQNTSVLEYEPGSAAPRNFDQPAYARTVEAWAPGLEQSPPKTTTVKPPPAKLLPEADAVALSSPQSIQPFPVKDFSTLNGPRAYVREDHSLPVVTIAFLFQGGRLTENASNSGITELMLRTMLSGTKRQNSSLLASKLDELGAEVEIINEPDYFGFLIKALSANAEKTLKVMRDVVEEPALTDPDVETARKQQIGAIIESRDDGPERAIDLLLGTIYPGNSYSMPRHGTEQSVGALKADQVRDWHEKTIKIQYPLVIVVGDTQGSELISEEIAGGFSRRTLAKSIEALVPRQPRAGQKVEQTSCPRTLLGVAFPGPKTNSPDLPAMEVAASAFRLSSIEKTGAFGGNSPRLEPMLAAGAVYSLAMIKSEDLPAVLSGFVSLARGLADKGMTETDMKTARARAVATRTALLYSQ